MSSEWRTFTDIKGRKLEGRILELGSDFVLVEMKKGGRQIPISFEQFDEKELETITNYRDTPAEKSGSTADTPGADAADGGDDAVPADDPERSKLYPRTRDEIRTTIREIMKRPAEKEIGKELQEATNTLNVYRFLCGVPYNVRADAKFSESATDAAQACKKNGL